MTSLASHDTDAAEAATAITLGQLETHRAALTGHCYRMLGSIAEAEDAVQETMLRAWRGLDNFAGRATLRTWMYRIATRVCLDALADNHRRARPFEMGPLGSIDAPLIELPASRFVEPIPDANVLSADADPVEQLALRQSIRLAFVAALQHLPPRQRAVLLLTEVLGFSAAEVAESLETSIASVNSALQRARATLASRDLDSQMPLSQVQNELLERYVAAFERYDMDALAKLLHEDVTQSMPPYSLWLRGRETICNWMTGRGAACRGSRLLPTTACGAPAFAQYRPSGTIRPGGGQHEAWALIVLEIVDQKIATINAFLDVKTLFPRFGLPLVLDP